MQTRKCKYCNKRNSIEETLFIWVYSFCWNECLSNYQKENKSSVKVKNTIRKVSIKKQQRIKEWWSEKDLFLEIRNERKHECEECWKYLKEAKAHNFDHIIPKSRWEKYRLDKNNIKIVCFFCHFLKTHWLIYKWIDLD